MSDSERDAIFERIAQDLRSALRAAAEAEITRERVDTELDRIIKRATEPSDPESRTD